MQILYRCCCGLDVHKKTREPVCCVSSERGGQRGPTFATMTAELLQDAVWLVEAGCTHVAMESTGVYWKPI